MIIVSQDKNIFLKASKILGFEKHPRDVYYENENHFQRIKTIYDLLALMPDSKVKHLGNYEKYEIDNVINNLLDQYMQDPSCRYEMPPTSGIYLPDDIIE